MPQTPDSETIVVENSTDPVEETRKIPNLSTLDDLRDLSAGSQIEVTRLTPSAIKGFCGNLIVPDGGMTDVLEEIQASHGGGKYQLRGKCTIPNGRLVYAQGAVQVDVAGYPIFQGKEYVNGIWRTVAAPAAAAHVVQMPNPGRQGNGGSMQDMLGGFVQTALNGALNSDAGINMGELPALITAIASLSGGRQERDSFDGVERAFALMAKMQEARPDAAPASDGEGMGGLTALLPMLMSKFGNQPQQPQQAPPQLPPQPQYPPAYQPYGAVPSDQMWSNMQQRPPAGPHPYPGHSQPPQPGNWTNPPQPPQSNGAPGYPPQAPPQQPPGPRQFVGHPSQPPVEAQGPGEEYDPLTVDDIMQDLAGRDESGRVEFLGELCTSLGLDKAMLDGMFPNGPPTEPAGPTGSFELNLPDK